MVAAAEVGDRLKTRAFAMILRLDVRDFALRGGPN
jgi:hypothetical protein